VAGFDEMGKGLTREAADLKSRSTKLLRRCALGVLRNLVMATPVGNKTIWLEPDKAPVGYHGGRARANWYVGIDAPNNTVSTWMDTSGNSALSREQPKIDTATHKNSIYICNNLPYIIPLNQGHSKQAPVGFIETAVQSGMGQGLVRGLTEK
jgi:hypothetical protein